MNVHQLLQFVIAFICNLQMIVNFMCTVTARFLLLFTHILTYIIRNTEMNDLTNFKHCFVVFITQYGAIYAILTENHIGDISCNSNEKIQIESSP